MRPRVLAAMVVLCAGCGPTGAGTPSAGAPALLEVALPDLSKMDAPVQEQVRDAHAALQDVLQEPDADAARRAEAFGRLGMLLDAAEYHDAAEPAYLNAQALAPDEPRWPYYLAHLYRSEGAAEKAASAFARVLGLKPDAVPALVWMGRMYLDQGQVDRAEPLFERARQVAPRTVAVLAGLGQAALARRDFARAVSLLEEALTLDPSAASIHSPLAMAYRGLGDTGRAEAQLEQWRNTEILIPDPWRQELDLALDSGLSYELRGVRALEARDFAAAAEFFRKGAALAPATTPLGRSLRHKLGTALYLGGDRAAAVEQFEEVLRLSPQAPPDETAGRAHYSLGILMASAGRGDRAIEHLTAAVRYSPGYVEALQALGDALRRAGRFRESLARYEEVLAASPQAAEARFGSAMALVRLGRYRDALDALSEGARRHPDRLEFTHAMARLLAAAPDASVRNGARAMALVDRMIAAVETPTPELGETTAMALAEIGNFQEAVAVQKQVIAASRRAGIPIDTERMMAALRRYERKEPSRVPWDDDDPVHNPVPVPAPDFAGLASGPAP